MNKQIVALVLASGISFFAPGAQASAPTGDYVEARTASVFAGACHWGGEYVSDGREAVMAWHFTDGDWQGVSLAGLSALAVVRADTNLARPEAQRLTQLYVDVKATPAQQTALVAALTTRHAQAFGQLKSVTPQSITFARSPLGGYRVTAPQVATLSVDALPDRACCKQPSNVWYAPLVPIQDRRVGYTERVKCDARAGGDAWSRSSENSAFYGAFTL